MEYCQNFSLCAYTRVNHMVWFTRLRCGSWSCEYCAAVNRRMWRVHLMKKMSQMNCVWYFITLTSSDANRSAALSLQSLRRGIDLLMKRMRRIWKKLEYVRVYEKHVSGAFHAHLIVSGLTPYVRVVRVRKRVSFEPLAVRAGCRGTWSLKTWFKKSAYSVGMGYMVDVRLLLDDTPGAISYVTKYMTKEAQNFAERYLRRVQTSRGIGSPRTDGGLELKWSVGAKLMRDKVRDACGFMRVYDLNEKMFVPEDYWREHAFYPGD